MPTTMLEAPSVPAALGAFACPARAGRFSIGLEHLLQKTRSGPTRSARSRGAPLPARSKFQSLTQRL
jgi:hypothetical protein